ncbi:C-type lectin domain family 10 member A-like isoform X2 [Struthio camelus]|uniref:C-type lectin domain family 10 member A-like isoform X2 n=2 Tax=Struthio camelus TaxID=8801 RepID=UPI00360410AA
MKHKSSLPPEKLMHIPDHINWDHIKKKKGLEMSQAVDDHSCYKEWETTKMMEMQDQEPRAHKGARCLPASCQGKAIALLYILLAFCFMLLMALIITSLQKITAMWEALEEARLRNEKIHAGSWQNLSHVQHVMDKQMSDEFKAFHSQLLNVSKEVENMRVKMTQCEAGCGKALSDRLRILEGRTATQPAPEELAELRREQSRTQALLTGMLEEMRNMSEVICTRCPAGWQQFLRTCYYFSTSQKAWMDAHLFCVNHSSHLAIIDSEQENKFLANQVMETRVFWLGLTDMHNEGDWQWVDGRPLSLRLWNSGEPNNVGLNGEDCATIYSSGRWNDALCSRAESWICERKC